MQERIQVHYLVSGSKICILVIDFAKIVTTSGESCLQKKKVSVAIIRSKVCSRIFHKNIISCVETVDFDIY